MNLLQKLAESKPLRRVALPFALAAGLAFGCSDKSSPTNSPVPPQPPVVETTLAENAVVFDAATSQAVKSYDGKTLIFTTEQPQLSVGDFLVSDTAQNLPNGLLRKVTAISSDKKSFTTDSTSLEQVIKNGEMNITLHLKPEQVASVSYAKGVKPSSQKSLFDFNYSIDSLTLLDKDGSEETRDDRLGMNGEASLNLDIPLALRFKEGKLIYFSVGANADQQANGEVYATDEFLSFDKSVLLANYTFHPITVFVPTTPPVPVVLVPKLEVRVNAQGTATISNFAVEQNAHLEAALTWDRYWRATANFTKSFSCNNPLADATMRARASISEEVAVLFYGVAGPSAKLEEGLELDVDRGRMPDWWKLSGTFDASLHAKVYLLGSTLADYSASVVSLDTVLARAQENVAQPVAHFEVTPTQGDAPLGVIGNAESSSSGRPIVAYLFNFGDGSAQESETPEENDGAFDGKRAHTYQTPGVFRPKVTVTDEWGRSAQDSALVTVREPLALPIAHLEAAPTQGEVPVDILFDLSSSTGRIVKYHFLSGDGQTHIEQRGDVDFDAKHQFTYLTPGTFWAKGEVTDSLGRTSLDSLLIAANEVIIPPDTLVQLTSEGNNFSPVVSPDAAKIAYAAEIDGDREIYLMNADGTNKQKLTDNAFFDGFPAFSPDGTQVGYVRVNNGNLEVMRMNLDGSEKTVVCTRANRDSPTGLTWGKTNFAFSYNVRQSDGSMGYSLLACDPEGQIIWGSSSAIMKRDPHWNPADSSIEGIVYSSTPDNPSDEEIMSNALGNLTNNASQDLNPAWSLDASTLVFTSNRQTSVGNVFHIWAMNPDGSNLRIITNSSSNDFDPYLFPDKNQVVFRRGTNLYKLSLDAKTYGASKR